MADTAEMLGRRIDRLKKKAEKAEKDARRYRWLKTKFHKETGWPDYNGYRYWAAFYTDTTSIDKAIDKAMKNDGTLA